VPFNNPVPRNFTVMSIRAHAPAAGGVYGLTNAREWLFIATTENIQQTLYTHLQEHDTSLMRREPVGFVYEACPASVRALRCQRLISEYGPVCNRGRAS
jgi:hypothetical protein